MKQLDHLLQRWRIAKAVPFVRSGDRLLDIGCFDRTLAERVAGRAAFVTGIDPAAEPYRDARVEILRGVVPGVPGLASGSFDCITLLAVLEHVPDPKALAEECARLLAPGGRLVVTVPHPAVDRILDLLLWLRLADGMDVGGHHGFDVGATEGIFVAAGLRLSRRARFQLGLNHLFVFEKEAAA